MIKFKKNIKVAIDSPAAAGAGTQAKLISSHYNLMYLDYDKQKGFGLYKQVDIWWNKDDDEISFTLQLIKLLVLIIQ